MIHHLLIALLAATPDAGQPGEFDAPVLIDINGTSTQISDGVLAPDPDDASRGCFGVKQCLPQGATCLTYAKAASIRDDLASKNARVASLETSLSTNWPLVLIIAGAGIVAAGAAAVGGYVAGRNSVPR